MSHERNLKYLNDNRIVYRRHPINDIPDIDNKVYMFYLNGTHECYELFRSSAKITTYKSLKWHLLVLWYLNPKLDQDMFIKLAEYICDKSNNFISFASKQMITLICTIKIKHITFVFLIWFISNWITSIDNAIIVKIV